MQMRSLERTRFPGNKHPDSDDDQEEVSIPDRADAREREKGTQQ
jgi:hypothetical protein